MKLNRNKREQERQDLEYEAKMIERAIEEHRYQKEMAAKRLAELRQKQADNNQRMHDEKFSYKINEINRILDVEEERRAKNEESQYMNAIKEIKQTEYLNNMKKHQEAEQKK